MSYYINDYGDPENVKRDATTLIEVITKQGSNLLLDVVAEFAGETANRFSIAPEGRTRLMTSLLGHFENALKERL